MFWVAGFDIIYACQDVDFDKRIGLLSIPARLGVSAALRLAAVCHMCMVGILACLPWVVPQWGWVYWVGMGSVACLLAWEHWLVRPGDLGRVNMAFFHVNSVVSVGLFLVGTLDLLV
jgi:4-hydroxybenzoate polyprenyltransferase